MAPRDPSKETVKVQRTIVKSSATKKPAHTPTNSSKSTLKKKFSHTKTTQQTPLEANNAIAMDSRKRTNTVPASTTPKKENKSTLMPGSVTKSTKKSWKRRPMPAHSGVPIPEKMKLMIQKRKQLLLNAKQSELV